MFVGNSPSGGGVNVCGLQKGPNIWYMNVLVLKVMIFEKFCMEDSLELDIDWDFAGLVKFGQKKLFSDFWGNSQKGYKWDPKKLANWT